MRCGAIAAALIVTLAACGGTAAVPLSPGAMEGLNARVGETLVVQAHHKPGHLGGRGRHLGWYKKNRGKHKGWRR